MTTPNVELQLNPGDMIEALTHQRNAAMDEIVRQGAIIRALQLKLQEKEKQDAPSDPQ